MKEIRKQRCCHGDIAECIIVSLSQSMFELNQPNISRDIVDSVICVFGEPGRHHSTNLHNIKT